MLRHDQLPPIPDEPRPLPDGPLYFVGIGGAGMSSIAQVLAEKGRQISGADPGISDAVRSRLEKVGVRVYGSHDAAQIADAAVIVVSDAIPEDNPEVRAARARGLPIFRRPEVLGAIVNAGRGICIAGTHGKTTTTGMVASILLAAGLDPTILLGGDLPAIGGNARAGKSDFVIAESCEAYDGFLYLHAEIAVVLNIEADHLDYHGDEAHVLASFERFIRQTLRQGHVLRRGLKTKDVRKVSRGPLPISQIVVWGGDDKIGRVLRAIDPSREHDGGPEITYGLSPDNTFFASEIIHTGLQTTYLLNQWGEDGDIDLGEVVLNVPGDHNVLNSLAAFTVGTILGIPNETIIAGLEAFTGTGRRFERIGEANDVLIVDDYAHHPTELRATLAAARSAYPARRIVAVFQPHLPSRTRDNMDAFAEALTMADAVYLTDIYLAREQPLPGISSALLAERTTAAKPGPSVVYVPNKADLPSRLFADSRPGDLILTMGAGDIRAAGERLLEELKR